MKKRIHSILVLLVVSYFTPSEIAAETDSTNVITSYPFILMDDPAQLFTMRQFDENYLSAHRYLVRMMNEKLGTKKSMWIQIALESFIFMPLTHEEGHRSILTSKSIGAISQPFFFDFDRGLRDAVYVVGVRDSELKDLRDNDLPTYIRLHTAGLESDYALMTRSQSLYALGLENKNILFWKHLIRTTNVVFYFASGAWPGLSSSVEDLQEEADELDRDIVGHDVYGAIRHLHRPTMDFYRYTQYDHLTPEEKSFGKRVGYRSFANLINPLFIKWLKWNTYSRIKISLGLGYAMSPFGDFIDENVWLVKGNTRLHLYLRQFQNKENWFLGGGIGVVDYPLVERVKCSVALDIWNQPVGLDFNTAMADFGGAVDVLMKYQLFTFGNKQKVKYFSADIGMNAKTEGFLPEVMFLDESVSFRLGFSFVF